MIRDRVIIVGGGLAGLAAAVELVDRNFDVTVIEAGKQCGGKLAAWQDKEGDPVEHGIHGWWPNYVNFFDLMERVGIPAEVLQVPPDSVGIFKDGSTLTLKPLLVRLPSPLFLAVHLLKSPIRGVADLFSLVRAGLEIFSFDSSRDFSSLDRFTFRSWLWRFGVSQRMYQAFFEPYVRSFAFDSATRISAAATLSSYHFYLIKHPDDIRARWLTDDPNSLIIEPILQYIQGRGGRVVSSTSVRGLLQDSQDRIVAVQTSGTIDEHLPHEPKGIDALARISREAIPQDGVLTVPIEHGRQIQIHRRQEEIVAYLSSDPDGSTDDIQNLSSGTDESKPGLKRLRVDVTSSGVVVRLPAEHAVGAEIARIPVSHLPQTQGFVLVAGDRPIFVGRKEDLSIVALSASCTHMGCEVAWKDGANGRFACPCHGAVFAPDGKPLLGPAETPLPTYATRQEGEEVVVLENRSALPVLDADHVILAVDIQACKRLLSDGLRKHETFRDIDCLSTTPVLVVRLWFPGARLLGDKTSGVLIDYPLLDNFFVLSNLQTRLRDRDETVIEVQAYLVEDEIELPDDRLLGLVLEDLRKAFPSLSPPPRKVHIQRHKSVFTHHAAGSDKHRPGTRTPVPNLHLAGDWVTRSPATWNMERAIIGGKLAAAAVVEDAGGIGPTIRSTTPGGVLFRTFVRIARAVTGTSRWIHRLVRGEHSPPPPSASVTPSWVSTIAFGVYKFRGQPNEQLVIGRFRKVTGQVDVVRSKESIRITGIFRIHLDSLESGNRQRDHNVTTVVFDTSKQQRAVFRLVEARPSNRAAEMMLIGRDFSADCKGFLKLNGIERPLCFRARVAVVEGGMLSVWCENDIELRARDFNLALGALQSRCGAIVDDKVNLSFRLAIPYVMAGAVP